VNLPPQLEQDIDKLREIGYDVEVRREPPDGAKIFVIIKDFPLPECWKNADKNSTDLLIIADISYPNSKLDMFWTETGVLLKDGRVPKNGDVIENYLNRKWRRFSWHCKSWNPAIDNIITYLDVVIERLRECE